jgi:peptidoglycan hydrolase-like protein with peptidoglycan-binding domain
MARFGGDRIRSAQAWAPARPPALALLFAGPLLAGLFAVVPPAAAQIAPAEVPAARKVTPLPVAKPTPTGRPAAAPAAPPAANPLIEAARPVFEALPLETRKAIQDALVWAGDYQGSVDGAFGKLTFDGILAFELKNKLAADGILDDKERAALLAAAAKQRSASDFKTVVDQRTGIRFGLPGALGTGKPALAGAQYQSADGKLTLATEAFQPGEADLAGLYEKLKTLPDPGRKVTYSVLRTDWFVVAGETATRRFYTRFGTGPDGLRGYTFGVDKTHPNADRYTVAIANAFEPFPSAAAVVAAPGAAKPPGQQAEPKPVVRAASGLIVAPGKVVTVSRALEGCTAPAVGGKPARVAATDGATGLVLLDADGAKGGAPLALRSAAPGTDDALVVIAVGEAGGLVVAPGDAVAAADGTRAGFRITTPLQRGGTGATVMDRSGAVVALIGAPSQAIRQIAGVVPAAPYDVSAGVDLAGFLFAQGLAATGTPTPGGMLTAGALATAMKGNVVQVKCGG